MSLSKFQAVLQYESDQGCEYKSTFKQSAKNPNANKVLLDLVEHLAWMGVVGNQGAEVLESFNKGYQSGIERKKELNNKKD